MNLCFDEELLDILNAEEVVYVSLLVHDQDYYFLNGFIDSSAYSKLYRYYSDEMPYGVARYKTGEADLWILDKLRERCL